MYTNRQQVCHLKGRVLVVLVSSNSSKHQISSVIVNHIYNIYVFATHSIPILIFVPKGRVFQNTFPNLGPD
jgi:hypothetical protein